MEPNLDQNLPPQIWGGIESTVNRVGDVYFDQLERNGHAHRISDLDHVARLGISAIRYPVLWERLAPDTVDDIDWSWPDERLSRLRELQIEPIVGLVHHGSGPRHTSLVEPTFATGLARFAAAVAARYPWATCYTPVNEPLTTARFSGLYGVWYPHGRDELTFANAYLNQLRAVVLAMREVRKVNPDAQLIQTEDLGKTHSTPALAYQAELENERRWLTFDLLCGKLNESMLMWDYLIGIGIDQDDLRWFSENPCPPDILGINHYLTSERYLDERLDLFARHSHGGNGRHQYADVEAVRVATVELAGVRGLLQEAWDRYQRPMAITELHLGCTREEQLRWFLDGWEAATTLRAGGIDLRAVTAWSMFGSFDWNSLVTATNNFYEPGVFDIRDGEPRPTAVARLIENLAAGGEPSHPTIRGTGWWRRDDRWFYPYGHPLVVSSTADGPPEHPDSHSIVLVGDSAPSCDVVSRLCDMRGLPHHVISPEGLNLHEPEHVLDEIQPWALVTELVCPEGADNRELDGLDSIRALGRYCAARDVPLLVLLKAAPTDDATYETEDGGLPDAPLKPVRTQPDGIEELVLEALPGGLVVRTHTGFIDGQDEASTEVLNTSLDLLIDGESGVWFIGPQA